MIINGPVTLEPKSVTALDQVLEKYRPWAAVWDGFAYAFEAEIRQLAMWCLWRSAGIKKVPLADALLDFRWQMSLTEQHARNLIKSSPFWYIRDGALRMKHPHKIRRLAYRRVHGYKSTCYLVPLAVYPSLSKLRGFSNFLVITSRPGEIALRTYTASITGRSESTLSRRRGVLYEAEYAKATPFHQRLTRVVQARRSLTDPLPERREEWGHNVWRGSDGIWRAYRGDVILLDDCRFVLSQKLVKTFEPRNNLTPPRTLLPLLSSAASTYAIPPDQRRERVTLPSWRTVAAPKARFFKGRAAALFKLFRSFEWLRSGEQPFARNDRWHRFERTIALLGGKQRGRRKFERLYLDGGLDGIIRWLRNEFLRMSNLADRFARRADLEREFFPQHSENCYKAARNAQLPPRDLSALNVFPQGLGLEAYHILRRQLNGHAANGIRLRTGEISADISI